MQVGRLTYGLLLLVLMPVVVVIAIPIFVVVGVVLFELYALVGEPDALASAVGIGWFAGSLLIMFLVLRRGHRWLARLIAIADAPAALIDPYSGQEVVETRRPAAWGEAPDPTTYRERVAAADARHTKPAAPPDEAPNKP